LKKILQKFIFFWSKSSTTFYFRYLQSFWDMKETVNCEFLLLLKTHCTTQYHTCYHITHMLKINAHRTQHLCVTLFSGNVIKINKNQFCLTKFLSQSMHSRKINQISIEVWTCCFFLQIPMKVLFFRKKKK
jgi:hypothetical protein